MRQNLVEGVCLSWLSRVAIVPVVAASHALAVFVDMLMPIGAGGPEIVVSDVEAIAEIVRAAPAIVFAGGRAAVFGPAAVCTAADGIEFIQV